MFKPCIDQSKESGVSLCPRPLDLFVTVTKIKEQITRSSSDGNSLSNHSRYSETVYLACRTPYD